MKKRLTLLLLALLLTALTLTLCACGGDDTPGGSTGTTYTVYCFKSEDSAAEEIKVGTGEGNTIVPAKKAHYKFLGYYTAEGTQVFDASGRQVQGLLIDKNITVYAHFEPIDYTVTFVVGEGTLPEGSQTSVTLNADSWQLIVPVPEAPNERTQFEGWYNKDFTAEFAGRYGTVDYTKFSLDNELGISNNEIKLYAKYGKRTVTVKIDYNDYTMDPKEIEVDYGELLGDLADLKINNETEGKEIVGFSIDPYQFIPYEDPLTEDITVYAVWKYYKQVKIHYGDLFPTEIFKVYEGDDMGAELPTPKKPGYRFDGFYDNASYAGNPIGYVPFHNLASAYHAKLTRAEYTLTFDTGDTGITAPEPMTYHYGDTKVLPDLSRDGYIFLGWSLERDGTGEIINAIPSNYDGNYTLYAVFGAKTCTVDLDANGGICEKEQDKIPWQGAYTLPVPTKTGYAFLGWFDGKGENAVKYADAFGASVRDWGEIKDGTLYARWQINTYTVIFDTAGGYIPSSERQKTYQYGAVLEFPSSTPEHTSKIFAGWYNADLSEEYVGTVVVTGDMKLKAKWVDSIAISNAEGLKKLSQNPAGTYHLTANINLGGQAWTPVAEFTGTLNGNGYKIYNFSLGLPAANQGNGNQKLGFILVNKGTVRNLTLDPSSVNVTQSVNDWSNLYVGIFAAENQGQILGCHVMNVTVTGDFTARDHANGTYTSTVCLGSIAGVNAGSIISCTSSATITAGMKMTYNNLTKPSTTAELRAGGIVGIHSEDATVSTCTYSGALTVTHATVGTGKSGTVAKGGAAIGGILGHNNEGNCTYNTFTGTVCATLQYGAGGVSAETTLDVGGIVALNGGEIEYCKSVGALTAQGKRIAIGGIASINKGQVQNSYSTSIITANGGDLHTYAGGAVAQNQQEGKISITYAAGTLEAEYVNCVGGFVGENKAGGTVESCYAAVDMELGTENGNCAFVDTNSGTITSSACAADVTLTLGGNAATPESMQGVELKDTSAELYGADYLTVTLGFATEIWKITGSAHPTLFFEK